MTTKSIRARVRPMNGGWTITAKVPGGSTGFWMREFTEAVSLANSLVGRLREEHAKAVMVGKDRVRTVWVSDIR